MKKSYRTGEVAKIFGVTPQTVRRWIDEKLIPERRTPGGQFFFLPEDLENLNAKERQEKWVYYVRSSSGSKTTTA